jgi:hypothetical protein
MTGVDASTSPCLAALVGLRASPNDPAASALIDRVARGTGWADVGGEFNLNLRMDAEPPVVLRVHRPWVRRGRVAGLGSYPTVLPRCPTCRHPRAESAMTAAEAWWSRG